MFTRHRDVLIFLLGILFILVLVFNYGCSPDPNKADSIIVRDVNGVCWKIAGRFDWGDSVGDTVTFSKVPCDPPKETRTYVRN